MSDACRASRLINTLGTGHGALTEASREPAGLLEMCWAVVGRRRGVLTGHQVKALFLLRVWPHLARQQGQLHWGPVYLWEFGERGHMCPSGSPKLAGLHFPSLLNGHNCPVPVHVFPLPAPQGCGVWAKIRLRALSPSLPPTGGLQGSGSRFGGQGWREGLTLVCSEVKRGPIDRAPSRPHRAVGDGQAAILDSTLPFLPDSSNSRAQRDRETLTQGSHLIPPYQKTEF